MDLCSIRRIKSLEGSYFSQRYVFILGIALSSILMIRAIGVFGSPSENLAIFSILVLISCLAKSVNFELSHPFIWFNIFFAVYSLSTPIMNMMGEYIFYPQYSKNFDYIQLISAQYLALLVFSLAVGPKTISYNLSIFKRQKYNSDLFRGSHYLLALGTIISLIYLYGIVYYGIKEKTDKIALYNPVLALSFCWMVIICSIVTILIRNKMLNKGFPIIIILLFSSYLPLSLLAGGDRHPLFYYLLTLIITIHIFYKKIKFRYFLFVQVIGMYLSTILGAFKMFLLSDMSIDSISNLLLFDYRNILLTIICSEFRTASENMAVALQAVPEQIPFLYVKPLLSDLMSTFIPTFLFPRETFETSVYWFNRTFFPNYFNTGAGVGFSLVATGYVNFGYFGIIGLFFLLGWALRKIYERTAKSLLYMIFYLCALPIFVLSIRADLATIFSQGLKHILSSILIMIVIGKFTTARGASVLPTGPKREKRRSGFHPQEVGRKVKELPPGQRRRRGSKHFPHYLYRGQGHG